MPLVVAQTVVGIFEGYFLAGAAFAVAFLWRGVARVDPRMSGAPKTLRLLILPGVVALWPLLASRWVRGVEPPIERNPHRALAR